MSDVDTRKPGLLERLAEGPVICAEGYLFEFERRGYLQAGAFVPEVVLEHPELVAQLHREFVHAGSDVVEAFTYYAHREKLQTIHKEHLLEPLNRQALTIAKEVADETGTLLAGDICNTNIYVSGDPAGAVRSMFEEQVGWAVEAGVDYVVGETFTWGEEALLGLEVIKATGLPAVITLAVHRDGTTGEGWTPEETCKRLEDAGADVVGVNCIRGPKTMFPLPREDSRARERPGRGAARAVPHDRGRADVPVTHRSGLRRHSGRAALPERARPVRVQPLRARGLRAQGTCTRGLVPRRLLRRGPAPHPGCRRGPRPDPAGEPVLAGHVEARVSGDGRADPAGVQGVRRQAVARCFRSRQKRLASTAPACERR